MTRGFHTCVIIYINRAPILWYSKRQSNAKTLTFGLDFVVMKTAVEIIKGLRYKICMMGVEVDGPMNVLCENKSAVKNPTQPESTLKKKHNAIAYHRPLEAQVSNIFRITWEQGETNLSDILKKLLPGPW